MEEKQDLCGSSLRSLVFRPGDSSSSSTGGGSGVAERKIQWRLGNLIGRGAFGSVYMGFNVDSGELLAVKQVLIGTNNASKEKAQERILELEEEVKLLKGLSHPNIVRYLGTAREKDTFNILLEYVPGGSITSLLGKFGSFSEPVIRTYTKQLLQGLQYLHHNNIIHRDIKGANILVDDKGCIKVADFGASKQVAQLVHGLLTPSAATITAAMSVKGTPYWMAPEVIVETGHSFSADIWSVGCTVIEMATGKRPWSQHYEEVAVLFHVGETKAHPPIPSKLSSIAKDFLLKCFQQEPHARPTAADLLQHPFVTGENQDPHQLHHSSVVKPSACGLLASRPSTLCGGLKDADYGGESCSTMCPEKLFRSRPMWETSTDDDMCRFNDSDDICRLGDKDDFPVVGSGFNPMSEPLDHWSCKSSPGPVQRFERPQFNESYNSVGGIMKGEKDLTFPCVPMPENESEVTETKVRAFLDQKEIELKKLLHHSSPFSNITLNASTSPIVYACKENTTNSLKLPPKPKLSPSKVCGTLNPHIDNKSPRNSGRRVSRGGMECVGVLTELHDPLNEMEQPIEDLQNDACISRTSYIGKRLTWKSELHQEIEESKDLQWNRGGLLIDRLHSCTFCIIMINTCSLSMKIGSK